MEMSPSIAALAKGLADAQKEFEPIPRTAENPFFKKKYAPLNVVLEKTIPALGKHGLSLIQVCSTNESAVTIETVLMHASGEWIKGTLILKAVKADPQGIGSTITYGRRYAASAMLCVASEEDEDGNGASDKGAKVEGKKAPEEKAAQKTEVIDVDAIKQTIEQFKTLAEQDEWANGYFMTIKNFLSVGDKKIIQDAYTAKRTQLKGLANA